MNERHGLLFDLERIHIAAELVMLYIGIVILCLGWFMMIFGVGVQSPLGGGPVANLHMMMISLGLIITGSGLTIAGAITGLRNLISGSATDIRSEIRQSGKRTLPVFIVDQNGHPVSMQRHETAPNQIPMGAPAAQTDLAAQPNSQIVGVYKGVDIYMMENGAFGAEINGVRVVRRSQSDLQVAIDASSWSR